MINPITNLYVTGGIIMKLLFLFSLLSSIFCGIEYAEAKQKVNQPPVVDAYITILDPQHLDSVRVNISKSYDPDGSIVRTRMIISAPGVAAVENENDHIFTYKVPSYVFPPIYTITVYAWDDSGAQSVYSKNVELNSDYKLNDVIANIPFNQTHLKGK